MKTGAVGRFYVTPHALRRYTERCRPHLSPARALDELVSVADRAERVRVFADGHELWRGPKRAAVPRLLFLVAPRSEGVLPAICTIPRRRKEAPRADNHRARARASQRAARRAQFLADFPPQEIEPMNNKAAPRRRFG